MEQERAALMRQLERYRTIDVVHRQELQQQRYSIEESMEQAQVGLRVAQRHPARLSDETD